MRAISVSREEQLRHSGWKEIEGGWIKVDGHSSVLPAEIAYELQTIIDTALRDKNTPRTGKPNPFE